MIGSLSVTILLLTYRDDDDDDDDDGDYYYYYYYYVIIILLLLMEGGIKMWLCFQTTGQLTDWYWLEDFILIYSLCSSTGT